MDRNLDTSKITEKIEKLEKRLDKKDKKIQQLENKINTITKKTQKRESQKNKEISRRSFLKKLGLGAAGLGALSLTPTSALNLKDDNFNVYTGTGQNSVTEYFSVQQNGPVQIKNTDLKITSNNQETLQLPTYTNSNLPTGKPEGTIAYDKTNQQLVIEDGT